MERGIRRVDWLRQFVRDLRTAAAESGTGMSPILWDLLVLNATRRIGVKAYFHYRLFDPRLTRKEKSEYLPDTHRFKARFRTLLNPHAYRLPFANKLVFNRIFGGAGLPVAPLLGLYDPELGQDSEGRSLRTAADLRDWLGRRGQNGFVFKPVAGTDGYQVLVFTGPAPDDPGSFLTMGGERYDADRLAAFAAQTARLEKVALGDPRPYLLEERIFPHHLLADLIGPTLCCVRVVTLIGRSGEPSILGAVYKIQPEPLGVDHLDYGALGSWVDLETGALGPGRSRQNFEYASVVPGTSRKFVGFQLPHWEEIKRLALRAATIVPWARAIGWDIGISEKGPVLIEGNWHWSTNLLQIAAPHGLMTGELKALTDALASGRKNGR
jgi:hypothetical protein